MKIRLMGTADEVNRVAQELQVWFEVLEVSRPYPCRGVRVYLELRLQPETS